MYTRSMNLYLASNGICARSSFTMPSSKISYYGIRSSNGFLFYSGVTCFYFDGKLCKVWTFLAPCVHCWEVTCTYHCIVLRLCYSTGPSLPFNFVSPSLLRLFSFIFGTISHWPPPPLASPSLTPPPAPTPHFPPLPYICPAHRPARLTLGPLNGLLAFPYCGAESVRT